MRRKTNEHHGNAQLGKLGTNTVKYASVNEKLEAEVISMCIVAVWVGHKSSRKMVKTYAVLDNWDLLLRKRSLKSLESLEGN